MRDATSLVLSPRFRRIARRARDNISPLFDMSVVKDMVPPSSATARAVRAWLDAASACSRSAQPSDTSPDETHIFCGMAATGLQSISRLIAYCNRVNADGTGLPLKLVLSLASAIKSGGDGLLQGDIA